MKHLQWNVETPRQHRLPGRQTQTVQHLLNVCVNVYHSPAAGSACFGGLQVGWNRNFKLVIEPVIIYTPQPMYTPLHSACKTNFQHQYAENKALQIPAHYISLFQYLLLCFAQSSSICLLFFTLKIHKNIPEALKVFWNTSQRLVYQVCG